MVYWLGCLARDRMMEARHMTLLSRWFPPRGISFLILGPVAQTQTKRI